MLMQADLPDDSLPDGKVFVRMGQKDFVLPRDRR